MLTTLGETSHYEINAGYVLIRARLYYPLVGLEGNRSKATFLLACTNTWLLLTVYQRQRTRVMSVLEQTEDSLS